MDGYLLLSGADAKKMHRATTAFLIRSGTAFEKCRQPPLQDLCLNLSNNKYGGPSTDAVRENIEAMYARVLTIGKEEDLPNAVKGSMIIALDGWKSE
jgi:hypothetical protein